MKNFFRQILKTILGVLTKAIIRKHKMDLIIITGWYGSSIVRELIYHLLKSNFNVRRNTNSIWWDLSIPLVVLGYEDRKRSFLEWIILIFKIIFSFITKPNYHHKIILNLDTLNDKTADFWVKYLKPHIFVILNENPKSKLLKRILLNKEYKDTLFIYKKDVFRELEKYTIKRYVYSQKHGDLLFKKIDNILVVKSKKVKIKIKIPNTYNFIWEFIPAAISVALIEKMPLKQINSNIIQFNLHPYQYKAVFAHLKRFIKSDE